MTVLGLLDNEADVATTTLYQTQSARISVMPINDRESISANWSVRKLFLACGAKADLLLYGLGQSILCVRRWGQVTITLCREMRCGLSISKRRCENKL